MKITISEKTEGPRHDPYSRKTFCVEKDEHVYEFVEGGLGYAELIIDGQSSGRKFGKDTTVLETQFEELVGRTLISLDDEWNENYEPDPFGHPSQYM